MRSGFIRTLWGFYGDDRPLYRCRSAMDKDIELLLLSKYEKELDVTTYVFGEDNYKMLVDKGLKCKLVDKNPMVWPDIEGGKNQMFRHKFEAFKAALDDYDRFVFLDLDCIAVKPLPENFWTKSEEKMPIQGSLMWYRKRKCKDWRATDQGLNPCACYVYIRDRNIPDGLIDMWNSDPYPTSEEQQMAHYMDNMIGGWQGVDKYWDLFEPDFFSVSMRKVYNKEKTEPQCFHHFHQGHVVEAVLNDIKNGKKPDWCI